MNEEYDINELKLEIVSFNDTLNGLEWRYTLRKDGWLWGHYKTREEAETAGTNHLERAIKYKNDWGMNIHDVDLESDINAQVF